MDITKNTTTEEIYAPVRAARQRLLEAVDQLQRAEVLAGALEALAFSEGEAYARENYRMMLVGALECGLSEEAAIESGKQGTVGLLLQSPNDTWSGRKNDARRAYADGVRSAASVLIRGY